MQTQTATLPGVQVITPAVHEDARGLFVELFRTRDMESLLGETFVQDNLSYSAPGTLRGLHFQRAPHEQGKLIVVLTGEIQDVVVDLRPESPTFGLRQIFELSANEPTVLFLPVGIAHGFCVPGSTGAWVLYKCSRYYNPLAESGIRWNDPSLAIPWAVDTPILSAKDAQLPFWETVRSQLVTPQR